MMSDEDRDMLDGIVDEYRTANLPLDVIRDRLWSQFHDLIPVEPLRQYINSLR
jgi:hypothetical protein